MSECLAFLVIDDSDIPALVVLGILTLAVALMEIAVRRRVRVVRENLQQAEERNRQERLAEVRRLHEEAARSERMAAQERARQQRKMIERVLLLISAAIPAMQEVEARRVLRLTLAECLRERGEAFEAGSDPRLEQSLGEILKPFRPHILAVPGCTKRGKILLGHDADDPSSPIYLSYDSLFRHTLAVGSSGSGKTFLIKLLVREVIRSGHSLVLLDMRGDLVDGICADLLTDSEGNVDSLLAWKLDPFREELAKRLVLYDLADEEAVIGLNPLNGPGDLYVRAHRVLDILQSRFSAFGPLTEGAIRSVLTALAESGYSITEIEPLLNSPAFRAHVIPRVRDVKAKRFLVELSAMNPKKRQVFTAPVDNKFGPYLAVPRVRRLLGASDALDWDKVLNRRPGSICLVSLASSQLRSSASLLGGLILDQITDSIFSRDVSRIHEYQKVKIVLDEFENFANYSLAELLAESRRHGASVLCAHQNSSQISKEMRDTLTSNSRVFFYFGNCAADATLAARELEPAGIEDAREEVMNLGIGEAFFMKRPGTARHLQVLHQEHHAAPPELLQHLRDVSNRQHARTAQEVDAEIAERTRAFSDAQDSHDTHTEVRHGTRPRID